MACVYYTASSLDGFASVGTLVMGSTTYAWLRVNQPGEWTYEQPSWVRRARRG